MKNLKKDESMVMLYKLDTKKNVQEMCLYIKKPLNKPYQVCTMWGIEGSENFQNTAFEVKAGKNIGKKNETSPEQQARLLLEQKINKKLKAGWVKNKSDAKKGFVDSVIKGGIIPMAAHRVQDHMKKLKYPLYVQPKLNGSRCVAEFKDGKTVLWSRSRKIINSCPHINAAVSALAKYHKLSYLILDGELYNHDYYDNFEFLMSAIKRDKPSEDSKLVQYHVYDTPMHDGYDFQFRKKFLQGLFSLKRYLIYKKINPILKRVFSFKVANWEHVEEYHDKYVSGGYEGIVIRDPQGLYEHKRTTKLLKYKKTVDDEFKIVDVIEGKGKLKGCVGAYVCKLPNSKTFKCKPKGNQAATAKYIKNKSLVVGRWLNVEFKGYTSHGVPREPIGIRFRDSKDF